MIKKIFLAVALFSLQFMIGQDKMPYQIYNAKGKKTTYKNLIKKSLDTQVVLFGEYHDNSLVHWLQLSFNQDLAAKKDLVLGAEMIEADNQLVLNQYLNKQIDQKGLDTLARLWNNYKTDYKPLVDFAMEKQFPFIATNIPRRYASIVFKKDFEGLNALTAEEKSWIAPLPIKFDVNLPGYQAMLSMMGGHAGEKMPKAQAIKDATMAHFILKNVEKESVFVHYNGTYHSDNYEGIYWYLKQAQPELKIVTIATVTSHDIQKFDKEWLGRADFIIVVDEDMTKTY